VAAAVIDAVMRACCGWALLATLAVILAACSVRRLTMAADATRNGYQSR